MYSPFFSTIHFIMQTNGKQQTIFTQIKVDRDYKLFIMNYTNVVIQKFT